MAFRSTIVVLLVAVAATNGYSGYNGGGFGGAPAGNPFGGAPAGNTFGNAPAGNPFGGAPGGHYNGQSQARPADVSSAVGYPPNYALSGPTPPPQNPFGANLPPNAIPPYSPQNGVTPQSQNSNLAPSFRPQYGNGFAPQSGQQSNGLPRPQYPLPQNGGFVPPHLQQLKGGAPQYPTTNGGFVPQNRPQQGGFAPQSPPQTHGWTQNGGGAPQYPSPNSGGSGYGSNGGGFPQRPPQFPPAQNSFAQFPPGNLAYPPPQSPQTNNAVRTIEPTEADSAAASQDSK